MTPETEALIARLRDFETAGATYIRMDVASPIATALEAESKRADAAESGWKDASEGATILTRIAEENRKRADAAEAKLKVAREALEAVRAGLCYPDEYRTVSDAALTQLQ